MTDGRREMPLIPSYRCSTLCSTPGRAEREGCDPSGPCLPFDLDRGAQAAVLEGDPKVGGFHIVQ